MSRGKTPMRASQEGVAHPPGNPIQRPNAARRGASYGRPQIPAACYRFASRNVSVNVIAIKQTSGKELENILLLTSLTPLH